MGGVAKAVGGGLSKGKGGENQGPSEGTIKRAMLHPDLIDPVHNAIRDATTLYGKGYSIPRMNARQREGIESIEDWAQQYGGQLGDATGNVANIAAGNRQGDAPGQGFLQSIYGGNAPKEGWDTLRGAIDLADDGSGGLDWLRETASGSMLGGNPYIDKVVGAMNRGTTDAYGNAIAGMEGSMSRAGGMGGSMEALLRGRENEGFTRALAENEANVRYADYGKERGYQEAARQALPGAHATEVNTMLGAGGAMNDAANQRLMMQMQAAQQAGEGYRSDINQQLGAAGLMQGLGTAGFMPGQQLMSAGEYTRSNLERQNNAGWEGLQQYLGTLGNVTNLFTGTNNAQQGPDPGAQLAGNLGQIGSMAAMGWMMSDRRLKTDIEPIGGGLYRWRYAWGGPLYEGPMAEDVAEAVPGPGGYLMIPASLVREVV